jgi:hypothetical protein
MKKLTVIGGDERLRILVKKLIEDGYTVDTLGLYDSDAADLETSNAVVLPVPTPRIKKRFLLLLQTAEYILAI